MNYCQAATNQRPRRFIRSHSPSILTEQWSNLNLSAGMFVSVLLRRAIKWIQIILTTLWQSSWKKFWMRLKVGASLWSWIVFWMLSIHMRTKRMGKRFLTLLRLRLHSMVQTLHQMSIIIMSWKKQWKICRMVCLSLYRNMIHWIVQTMINCIRTSIIWQSWTIVLPWLLWIRLMRHRLKRMGLRKMTETAFKKNVCGRFILCVVYHGSWG